MALRVGLGRERERERKRERVAEAAKYMPASFC